MPLAPNLDALAIAADAGADYRRRISAEERSPVDPYADVLTRFAGPLPETGGESAAIIEELIENATGGIRAMTSPLRGQWVMRVSVCSLATTPEDGRITGEAVRAAWEKVRAGA